MKAPWHRFRRDRTRSQPTPTPTPTARAPRRQPTALIRLALVSTLWLPAPLSRSAAHAQASAAAPVSSQAPHTAPATRATLQDDDEDDDGADRDASHAPARNEGTTTAPLAFLALRRAPPDIAAFPARPDDQPAAAEPGVEVHGFVAAWVTPWSEVAPNRARDHFRLRFGVLRVDARPAKHVSVLARLGMMLPSSPLLDFALTYAPSDIIGVTIGQFRLPIGAAATTLAPQLVLLDRPSYVYAMTKLAFRDVGAMVHSGARGIADGLFHYRFAITNGSGRAGVGPSRAPEDLLNTLLAARVMLDLGRVLSPAKRDRLVLGASYLRSSDPAIATGDAARDRDLAVNVLGRTLTPIGRDRITQLSGADLTFSYGPIYAQTELLYLRSVARDHSVKREGFGSNLDLAYILPIRPWNTVGLQLAARIEHFNPRFAEAADSLPNDEVQVYALGLNVLAGAVRTSLFGSLTRFEDPTSRVKQRAGELSVRAAAAF